MSKLNQPTNLRAEDYPDQSAWIGKLFSVLNPFIRSVQQVFDSNIDFTSNIRSITRSFDQSTFQYPIRFSWPFTQAKPSALVAGQATAGTSATILIPAWTFDASSNEIVVAYLTEITSSGARSPVSGTRYQFTLRATV